MFKSHSESYGFFNFMPMHRSYVLTKKEMDQIHKMFFGPYKKEWYVGGVVDNNTSTIAKRLNLQYNAVSYYIDDELDKLSKQVHDENLNKTL